MQYKRGAILNFVTILYFLMHLCKAVSLTRSISLSCCCVFGMWVVSKVAKAKLYGEKLNSMKKLFTFLLSTFAFLYGVLTDSELYFKIIISVLYGVSLGYVIFTYLKNKELKSKSS